MRGAIAICSTGTSTGRTTRARPAIDTESLTTHCRHAPVRSLVEDLPRHRRGGDGGSSRHAGRDVVHLARQRRTGDPGGPGRDERAYWGAVACAAGKAAG